MMGKQFVSTLILAIALIPFFCNGQFTTIAQDENGQFLTGRDEPAEVEISPKCAAVLLSGGAAGGAGIAYAMAPTALCAAGFCPAGVSGGSFASWWQSTMPLVNAGGFFATLQSVAMGGALTKVAVTGSVLGGSLSLKYLEQVCAFVDDPNSTMAPVFDMNLRAVKGTNQVADQAKVACSLSESCSAAADLAQSASESASSWVSSIWNGAGQAVEAISNKAEVWYLEEKVRMLKEQINDLRESSYIGKMIKDEWHHTWSHKSLNWLSSGVLEKTFTLEKELQEKEARLLELEAE